MLDEELHPSDLLPLRGAGRAGVDPGRSGLDQMPEHGAPTWYINCEELDRTPVSLLKSGRLESTLPSLDLRKTTN